MATPKVEKGYVVDPITGLVIPARMNDSYAMARHPLQRKDGFVRSGTTLEREETTGLWRVPAYGSGWDDYYMRAIVIGDIRNVGATPVVDSYLSTLVAKRQAMASTWQILLSGRSSPVKRFLDVLAMANDGEGVSEFVKNYIGALDVDNRGAMFAFLPFGSIAPENWGDYGMRLVPMPGDKQERYYILEAEQQSFSSNYGLWNIDGLETYPTGNPSWPYWYRTVMDGKPIWVLISGDYGGQVRQQVGPKDKSRTGIGQSGSWRYVSILAVDFLIQEMDLEALFNQPPRGIVWGAGLDTPTQLLDQLAVMKSQNEREGVLLYPGVLFGGSVSDKSRIVMLPWVEPPHGYTPDGWKKRREDVLSACFHMSVSQIVTRLGEGAFTQSRVTDDIQAETGIAWMRVQIERVLNHAAPPRVVVTVNWQSDRQRRYQVETLGYLGSALAALQNAGGGNTFQVEEIRAIVEEMVMPIPVVAGRDVSATTRDTGEDVGEEENGGQGQNRVTESVMKRGNLIRFIIEDTLPPLPDAPGLDRDKIIAALAAILLELGIEWDGDSYSANGEELSVEEIVEMRDRLVARAQTEARELARGFADEDIALSEWVVSMRELIVYWGSVLYFFGLGGGEEAITDSQLEYLGGWVMGQFGYLQQFAGEAPEISGAQIVARARLYGSAMTSVFEQGHAGRWELNLPQYPGDCQTLCCVNCKCYLEIVQGGGEIHVFWRRTASESCADCIRLEGEWNPYVVDVN